MYLLVVLAICTPFVCVMLINSYLCGVAGEKSGNDGKALGLLYLKIAKLTNNEKKNLLRANVVYPYSIYRQSAAIRFIFVRRLAMPQILKPI